MEVKKMSSKFVKPVKPTPPNLKNYKISFLDSHHPPMNIALILFYEFKPEYYSQIHLEESLAETLVQFYPLAGRFIKEDNSVDCSDQGAEFIEAEASGIDLVSVIGTDQHNHLFPDQYFRVDETATQPLLSIQATRFASGGTAVAISVSHRVFDFSSLATFVAAWSSTTTNPGETIVTPSFDIASLLPANERNSIVSDSSNTTKIRNTVAKILHFDKATIASLKSKIGKPVSGARAVSAAIAKALIHLEGGRSRGFHLFQPVNMRGRTTRPVGKHACGNFGLPSLSRRVDASEAEGVRIAELSGLIGEAVRRSIGDNAEVVSAERDGRDIVLHNVSILKEALGAPDTNLISFTDWTKFGLQEVELGWGKPCWMSCGPQLPKNSIATLMSSCKEGDGDGIEAWLHFNPIDMNCVHQDWELINRVIHDLTH